MMTRDWLVASLRPAFRRLRIEEKMLSRSMGMLPRRLTASPYRGQWNCRFASTERIIPGTNPPSRGMSNRLTWLDM
jgi:hypothetical protein